MIKIPDLFGDSLYLDSKNNVKKLGRPLLVENINPYKVYYNGISKKKKLPKLQEKK